ncbi:uncharacterized protein [Amphiura filiformis]|uniref:uncharacterized protein n=1 Tax=Amphiura filiformis TaxID=82378 RepID=UPI003B22161F
MSSDQNDYEVNLDGDGYINPTCMTEGGKGNGEPCESIYDDIQLTPVSTISKPMKPMKIAEPQNDKDNGNPNGICTVKKLCFIVVVVIISCIVSVGAFYGIQYAQGATNNKESNVEAFGSLQASIVCPSVKSSSSSSVTFNSPKVNNFPHSSSITITYTTGDGNIIGTISSSSNKHTLEDLVVGFTQVTASAEDMAGNKATCDFTYHRTPGPVVLCPSVSSSLASTITFSSPTVHFFPNTSDVSISYSRNGTQISTFPLSDSEHSLRGFLEGSTTVILTAMDSAGNTAKCQFTYTRMPAPVIVCPSISKSTNNSVSFESPVLRNFPHPELVFITYSEGGRLMITLPAMATEHHLNFDHVGTTVVTAVASDSTLFASCNLNYYLIPDIQCPDSMNISSTTRSFARPVANFPVSSPYYYSRAGALFSLLSPTSTQSLYYFHVGESTEVTLSVAGESGLGASCTFTVTIIASEGQVRLVNGVNRYEGRVEIYHDNIWGTVCDDSWDADDAKAVCRQLGYSNIYAEAFFSAHFGEGSGQIWLDNVNCMVSESRLDACSHNGWGNENCVHGEDAGVVCTSSMDYDTNPAPIRLVDGRNSFEGRVEVQNNGIWGTVCDYGWSYLDAIVVCRQLGFPYGATEAFNNAHFGEGSGDIWLEDVACTGSEEYLSQCVNRGWDYDHYACDHSDDAGVVCADGTNFIRLADGSSEFEGRVEILHNGMWGTVCSDSWSTTDAQVVCRQLGFPYGDVEAHRYAAFGPGTGEIWMDNVDCVGSEDYLNECSYNGWGIHNCVHTRDASVICK